MINFCKMFAFPSYLKDLVEIQVANIDEQKNKINYMLKSDIEEQTETIIQVKTILISYRTCGL